MAQKREKSISSSSFYKKRGISPIDIANKLNYAEQIFEDSISKAVKIVEENLLLAIENKFKREEAKGYQILGRFNQSLSNYSLAVSNFNKALKIVEVEKDLNWNLEIRKELGLSYESNNKNEEAVAIHIRAIELSKQTGDKNRMLFSIWKIGELKLKLSSLTESKSKFEELKTLSELNGKEEYKIKALIGLGRVAMQEKKYKNAQTFFENAQQLAEQIKNDELTNEAFDYLTILYENQKDLDKSIYVQQKAYDYNNTRGNVNSMLNNSTNISKNYLKQGRSKEAIDLVEETKPLAFKEDNSLNKIEFLNTASEVYKEVGLAEKANLAKEDYQKLADSFNISRKQKQILEEAKNEFLMNVENKMLLMEKDRELSEKTIELLKKDQVIQEETIRRQQSITTILFVGLGLISLLGFLLLKNNRQKKKNNKLLILKSLRTQMNPHFIFNSLNSVNSFIAKKDEKSANKYLSEFSKLMREVLEYSQEEFIPLSKEIGLLKRYIQLEHFRFNSDFEYTFTVDDAIILDDYQLPPMLLQPFVENAIWHGLRYKKEKGILDIKFIQKPKYLEITISDDGIGREKSMDSKTINQKKMKSTGIKNVENRLEIIQEVFKKKLIVEIENLDNEKKEGTKVTLKLD